MSRRAGAALLELLAAAVLLGVVSTACAVLVHSQTLLLADIVERAATDEALRAARATLAGEVRAATTADVRVVARDSLALRVFRGAGIVCSVGRDFVTLRYRGLRLPDADKDSLLVTGEDRTTAVQLSAAVPQPCARAADEDLVAIRTTTSLPLGGVLLFFESGAYHIANSALRYRRGLEGRQPLTDERLDDRHSRFALETRARGIAITLAAPALRGFKGSSSELRVRFLNGAP